MPQDTPPRNPADPSRNAGAPPRSAATGPAGPAGGEVGEWIAVKEETEPAPQVDTQPIYDRANDLAEDTARYGLIPGRLKDQATIPAASIKYDAGDVGELLEALAHPSQAGLVDSALLGRMQNNEAAIGAYDMVGANYQARADEARLTINRRQYIQGLDYQKCIAEIKDKASKPGPDQAKAKAVLALLDQKRAQRLKSDKASQQRSDKKQETIASEADFWKSEAQRITADFATLKQSFDELNKRFLELQGLATPGPAPASPAAHPAKTPKPPTTTPNTRGTKR